MLLSIITQKKKKLILYKLFLNINYFVIIIMVGTTEISRRRLLKKSERILQTNLKQLSNKALLKIVNRYNVNKKF